MLILLGEFQIDQFYYKQIVTFYANVQRQRQKHIQKNQKNQYCLCNVARTIQKLLIQFFETSCYTKNTREALMKNLQKK
ncbi:unnamed protein product [Paramecium octaurelia]|uniref:Uncharacterized protein n=1 Tax=Paramecium octaurelia TaxID=43137 RepID=A0A8S1YKU0_PAROT|nr:unnamed protein product [Paramecium octaurelia]